MGFPNETYYMWKKAIPLHENEVIEGEQELSAERREMLRYTAFVPSNLTSLNGTYRIGVKLNSGQFQQTAQSAFTIARSLSVCLSTSLSAYLSVCLSVCMSACLPVCMYACLPICLSVYMSVSVFLCMSVSFSLFEKNNIFINVLLI